MKIKLRRILKWGAINLALVLIVLVSFEFYLRQRETYIVKENTSWFNSVFVIDHNPKHLIRYTSRGRRLIPNTRTIIRNHHLSKRDVLMTINSNGFRDKQLSRLKKANELRILILGDSITWADYLPVEEVYVERIEKYLSNAIKSRKVEVINGGVGDIGIREEIDILQEQGLELRPDVVIVAFYLNDSRPPWGFPEEINSRGWLRRNSVLVETIYRKLKLQAWMKKRGKHRFQWREAERELNWAHDRDDFLKLVSLAKYDWGAAWEEDSWDIVAKQLEKLKSLSQQHGFSVAVVAFPVAFQVYSTFVENTPQERLRKTVTELGIEYYDLLPLLREHSQESLFFDQCHPRKKANDIIGRVLADFLREGILSEYD